MTPFSVCGYGPGAVVSVQHAARMRSSARPDCISRWSVSRFPSRPLSPRTTPARPDGHSIVRCGMT
ncbi:MAG TPA: hypothetical protein DCQ64_22165 [Candidatus Rokubacteria bacterium]|nr:hypothetical protein [Candidatus Rokubacteria bacterium]